MATIYSRPLKDGSLSWRLQIRRKGLPIISLSFCSKQEAQAFAKANEGKYMLGMTSINIDRLTHNRKNELRRKK